LFKVFQQYIFLKLFYKFLFSDDDVMLLILLKQNSVISCFYHI